LQLVSGFYDYFPTLFSHLPFLVVPSIGKLQKNWKRNLSNALQQLSFLPLADIIFGTWTTKAFIHFKLKEEAQLIYNVGNKEQNIHNSHFLKIIFSFSDMYMQK